MNIKIRFFVLLPVILLSVACRMLFSTPSPIPTFSIGVRHLINKSSTIRSKSITPSPSVPKITALPTLAPSLDSTSTPTPNELSLQTQLHIFDDLWSIVNDTYVYPDFNGLDWNAMHERYVQIISAGLTDQQFYNHLTELINSLGDDHSYFIDPQQVAEQEAEFQGNHDYVGIGIMVSAVPDRQRAVIISVIPGSPAGDAGLEPRDSILSVDGIPILDDEGYLRNIVRGPEGTTIAISVQTPGELPRLITLMRQRITGSYPVAHQVISTPDGKRIGYIFISTFMDGTVDDQVAKALREMTSASPLDGLILDNRMNGGGSSLVLEPILGFFSDGNLGNFVNRSELNPLIIESNDINGSSKVPLVVLIGSGTASFGEIFSGILQNIGRAYLIGTTTDGNVEILWGYDFEDGSQLWLANETFQPINHPEQDWETSGIIPDLSVSGEFDQYTMNNDPVIKAAIQYLSGQ
jgi:carboxyl-terminal processing protease